MTLVQDVVAAQSEKTSAAPLDIIARAVVGDGDDATVYVIGTRTTLARAALYTERVKDGETKHRPANTLADIAQALSATFVDADGDAVEVF